MAEHKTMGTAKPKVNGRVTPALKPLPVDDIRSMIIQVVQERLDITREEAEKCADEMVRVAKKSWQKAKTIDLS